MSRPTGRGCLITFEGVEGAGKSTHLALLARELRARGHQVVTTREPGATAMGSDLRTIVMHRTEDPPAPMTELLLYLADRAQHLEQIIRPGLAAGAVVLCDRFSGSTIAYQGYGRDLDVTMVRQLDAAVRGETTPALTILLDCPVETGLQRAEGNDRLHCETIAFHGRVRDGFRHLAATDSTWVTIPTSGSRDAVARLVLAAVLRANVLPVCASPTS